MKLTVTVQEDWGQWWGKKVGQCETHAPTDVDRPSKHSLF